MNSVSGLAPTSLLSAATQPQPARRRTPSKPKLIGGHCPGHRSIEADPYDAIYYGSTSAYGSLGPAAWWIVHGDGELAGLWCVASTLCGARVTVYAVVDDFGDLQVVRANPWSVATVPDRAWEV